MSDEDQKQLPTDEPVKPQVEAADLVVHDTSEFAMLFDSARFNQAQRVAKLFASSQMVPAHFRGKTADVFVALHLATRMQLDPFMVMSKAYPVGGKIGLEAQLIIALVNARGPFKGPIQWRFEGEGKTETCIAYATHKTTGEICEAPVDWAMVDAEGWSKNPKWSSMRKIMFRYRSAVFLARLYCPEVILGLSTIDELEDIGGQIIDIQPTPEPPAIEKKPLAEKIKTELKGRKPRSDRGTTRSPKTGEVEKLGESIGTMGENPPEPPPSPTEPFLTSEHGKEIEQMMKQAGITDAALQEKFGDSLANLPDSLFEKIFGWLADLIAKGEE